MVCSKIVLGLRSIFDFLLLRRNSWKGLETPETTLIISPMVRFLSLRSVHCQRHIHRNETKTQTCPQVDPPSLHLQRLHGDATNTWILLHDDAIDT